MFSWLLLISASKMYEYINADNLQSRQMDVEVRAYKDLRSGESQCYCVGENHTDIDRLAAGGS